MAPLQTRALALAIIFGDSATRASVFLVRKNETSTAAVAAASAAAATATTTPNSTQPQQEQQHTRERRARDAIDAVCGERRVAGLRFSVEYIKYCAEN